MHDRDDVYRARSRRLARRPVESPFATGTPAMAGYVTSAPSGSNVFLSMNPVTIGGDEVEGGPFTRDVSSDTLIIAGVGKKPLAGMDTIAGFFPHRWASFVRSDTICDDPTAKAIKLTIPSCNPGVVPAPQNWDVSITLNGVLINDGVTTYDPAAAFGGASVYSYPITRAGTYVITATKARFATQTFTRAYKCEVGGIAVGAPGYAAPGYNVVACCPDNPISHNLTGNDGFGDFALVAGVDGSASGVPIGSCGAGATTVQLTRTAHSVPADCLATTPTLADRGVFIEIGWGCGPGANVGGLSCGKYSQPYMIPGSGNPPGAPVVLFRSATIVSHSVSCSPFRSTTVLTATAPLDQVYGGTITVDVTE